MENKEITYRNIGAVPGRGNAYVIIERCGNIDVNKYKAYYDDVTGFFTLYPYQSLYRGLVELNKKRVHCRRVLKDH